jgi:hypothetical protein
MRMHPLTFILAVALATALSTIAVHAAGAGTPGVQIPYNGHLDLDGSAVTTATRMTFTVFDDPVAGTQLSQDALLVTPVNGLFTVVLGGGSDPLTDAELAAKELWLAIDVEGNVVGARQQIYAATQTVLAKRAESATDFHVTQALIVDNHQVAGVPTPTCITMSDVSGAPVKICGDADSFQNPAFGGIEIDAPTISGNHHMFRAGSLAVEGDGDVEITGDDLTVRGQIHADDDVIGNSVIVRSNNGIAGLPGSPTKDVDMTRVSTSCTLGKIEYRSDVLAGNTDGICMCLVVEGATGEWCIHPDVN